MSLRVQLMIHKSLYVSTR